MNKFIKAVKALDLAAADELLRGDAKWKEWSEADGKNALHFLCGLAISEDPRKVEASLRMMSLLLQNGMDMNAIHRIPDPRCGFFPATPLWYAYTRGRNERLYTYLLDAGADPNHCMFAIAWYDDVQAADLFKRHGAELEEGAFLAAYKWKRFQVAEWMLHYGANADEEDSEGNTALHHAVRRNDKREQVQVLLAFGADPDHQNNAGMSPRNAAIAEKRRKYTEIFASS